MAKRHARVSSSAASDVYKRTDRISSRAAKAGGKGNEKRATRLSAKAVGKTAERNFLVEDYNSKIDNPKNSKYVSNK